VKRLLYFFDFLIVVCLTATTSAQNEGASSFRFALVTDTHLKQLDSRNATVLRKAVYDINAQKEIEFVIVAGDIADKGDQTSMRLVKQILDSLRVPYHIIPGNHDTRYCTTSTGTFDSVFVEHHFSFTHRNYRFIGFNTGQGGGLNGGSVMPEELAWIQSQLTQAGTQQPIFAITHFPLLDIQVTNAVEVINTLLLYNIQAVLGGHYHRNAVFDYSGIPGVLTRTLQPNIMGKSGYSVIEVANEIRFFEKDIDKSTSTLWLTLPLNPKTFGKTTENAKSEVHHTIR